MKFFEYWSQIGYAIAEAMADKSCKFIVAPFRALQEYCTTMEKSYKVIAHAGNCYRVKGEGWELLLYDDYKS